MIDTSGPTVGGRVHLLEPSKRGFSGWSRTPLRCSFLWRSRIAFADVTVLSDLRERVIWQIEGSCEDANCDKYIYLDLFKKKYKPILEHSYSCMPSLKRELATFNSVLSLSRYKKYRFQPCDICKKPYDDLGYDAAPIIGFIAKEAKNNFYEWRSVHTHAKCRRFVKTPEGFKKS